MTKLIIFDLDDTLYLESDKLCEDAIWCLDYLKNKGHQLAIASHNIEGLQLLHRFDIHDYFIAIECFIPGNRTKMPLINAILDKTGQKREDVIFFDDLLENITEVSRAGIHSVKINPYSGITFLDIHNAGL